MQILEIVYSFIAFCCFNVFFIALCIVQQLLTVIFRIFIILFLDWARSCKIGVVVNNWLVGNAVSSETALRIFLMFCIKLGDYKGRKVTAGFLKKILDLEMFAKMSPD